MNKKISLGAAIAFALLVAAAIFSVTMVYSYYNVNQILGSLQQREQEYAKFSEIDREVRENYYGEIQEKELQDSIAEGYVKGIGDPHAEYYSAEEYSLVLAEKDENVGSIGTKQKINSEGYIEITEVYEESPASNADIKPGSLIVEIDGEPVSATNSEQKIVTIEGPEGSQIKIVVREDGNDQDHELVRRVVVVPTFQWEMLENTHIAYARFTGFDSNTANQFTRGLKEIQEAGSKGIVFDLRDLATFDLGSSTRILDRIVPAGPLISKVYKDGTIQELETSDTAQLVMPMVVLTNGGTAGTQEIFTQVLKDYGKAKSVGSATAGKGISLEIRRLSDGSAVELTSALYQSPSGKTFDGEGVQPDYEVLLSGMEESQWIELSKSDDPQLAKAIEVVSAS